MTTTTGASFDIPFIAKYQPSKIHEFEQLDENTITIIHSLILMDNLNIMFYGDSGSGKTSIINAMIREYYNKCASTMQKNAERQGAA